MLFFFSSLSSRLFVATVPRKAFDIKSFFFIFTPFAILLLICDLAEGFCSHFIPWIGCFFFSQRSLVAAASATFVQFAVAEFRVYTSACLIYIIQKTATALFFFVSFNLNKFFFCFCFICLLLLTATDFGLNLFKIYVVGNQCAHSFYAPTKRLFSL